jgi:hypothetical protein
MHKPQLENPQTPEPHMNPLFVELVNMIAGGTSNRHFTAAITYITWRSEYAYSPAIGE